MCDSLNADMNDKGAGLADTVLPGSGADKMPSTRLRNNRQFKGFLERQRHLTDYLDDMFHVKQ